jgi:flagellar biosynthesis GTPase FlhF
MVDIKANLELLVSFAKALKKCQKSNNNNEKSDNEKSDNEKSDNEKSDNEKSDNEKSDNEKSDNEKSDNEKSDNEKSDNEKSDNEKSDNEKSDNEKSDNEKSDNEKSDNETSDNETSDNETSDIIYAIRILLGDKPKKFLETRSFDANGAYTLLNHPYLTEIYCVEPIYYDKINRILNKVCLPFHKIIIYTNNPIDKFLIDNLIEINFKIDILLINEVDSYEQFIQNYLKFILPDGYIIFNNYTKNSIVKTNVDILVNNIKEYSMPFDIIGCLSNYPNQFIIRRKNFNNNIDNNIDNKMFAIVMPTYYRKNGTSKNNHREVSEMLKKQTYTNWKIFMMGDDYEKDEEFNENITFFPSDKIYAENIKGCSYRRDVFTIDRNKWCNGGLAALHQGIVKAIDCGYSYYVHLDDDDRWTDNHLQLLADTIKEFPNADFLNTCSTLGRIILPKTGQYVKLYYNNVYPTGNDIVHATWCLNLKTLANVTIKFNEKRLALIEQIRKKEIVETNTQPYDYCVVNHYNDLFRKGYFNSICIPKITCCKKNDMNIP